MTNSMDRQGILDNLTAIETTAKLLVNAFVKKNNDVELSLNGIHRDELITQTTTFLSQAQKLIFNLSNTFNLSTDGFFDNKNLFNEQCTSDGEEQGYEMSKILIISILFFCLELIRKIHHLKKHIHYQQ